MVQSDVSSKSTSAERNAATAVLSVAWRRRRRHNFHPCSSYLHDFHFDVYIHCKIYGNYIIDFDV